MYGMNVILPGTALKPQHNDSQSTVWKGTYKPYPIHVKEALKNEYLWFIIP